MAEKDVHGRGEAAHEVQGERAPRGRGGADGSAREPRGHRIGAPAKALNARSGPIENERVTTSQTRCWWTPDASCSVEGQAIATPGPRGQQGDRRERHDRQEPPRRTARASSGPGSRPPTSRPRRWGARRGTTAGDVPGRTAVGPAPQGARATRGANRSRSRRHRTRRRTPAARGGAGLAFHCGEHAVAKLGRQGRQRGSAHGLPPSRPASISPSAARRAS